MIIPFKDTYKEDYKEMIVSLWPDIDLNEIEEIILEQKTKGHTIFLYLESDKAVAFLNSSIRNDYVEGCDQSPVGYIEGIYVKENHRKQAIAKKLVAYAIDHFKKIGIKEIASDTETHNTNSIAFHKAIGFIESSRIVHFKKKIGD